MEILLITAGIILLVVGLNLIYKALFVTENSPIAPTEEVKSDKVCECLASDVHDYKSAQGQCCAEQQIYVSTVELEPKKETNKRGRNAKTGKFMKVQDARKNKDNAIVETIKKKKNSKGRK